MIAELAHAAHAGAAEVAHPVHIQEMASYIVGIGAVLTIATVGIVAYVKLRFSKVEGKASGIGKALDEHKKAIYYWRDTFTNRYQRDREDMIREYATQASVEKVEERMEAIRTEMVDGMRAISQSVDRLRDKIGIQKGGNP